MRSRRKVLLGAGLVSLLLVLGGAAEEPKKPEKPLDLNRASAEELEKLPGVGEVIAGRIIRHREVSGRFQSVDELLIVRGISRKKLEKLRPHVTVAKEAEDKEKEKVQR